LPYVGDETAVIVTPPNTPASLPLAMLKSQPEDHVP
jgi:hypothetical protein